MKNTTAMNAFIETIAELNARVDELKTYVENHMVLDPDKINWGHVGYAQDYLKAITELTDRAYRRGEYAE